MPAAPRARRAPDEGPAARLAASPSCRPAYCPRYTAEKYRDLPGYKHCEGKYSEMVWLPTSRIAPTSTKREPAHRTSEYVLAKWVRNRLRISPLLILGIIVSAEAALIIGIGGASPMSTPGRSRTDTGDPFRGSASSFGLRGRHHNTARTIAQLSSNKDSPKLSAWPRRRFRS